MRKNPAIAAAALVIALAVCSPGAGADITVISTSFSPAELHPDDSITFYIQLDTNDTKNISKAYLIYCSVDDGVCYPQKEMKYMGEGNYSIDAGKFKEGEWKYNITMQLKDGNITWTPDTHFFVKKETPGNGGGDQNNTTGGNGSKKDNRTVLYIMYGAVGSMAVITILAAVFVLRTRRKGPEG
jgi:hypothetical protein